MKKIIILALCAVSFAVAAPKKCVSFADTAGEGCWIYWYSSESEHDDGIYAIYEVKGEQSREVCNNSTFYGGNKCSKILR